MASTDAVRRGQHRRRRTRGRPLAPERAQRGARRHRLPVPTLPARAQRPVGIDLEVPDLGAEPVRAAQHLAAGDDPAADAGAERDEQHLGAARAPHRARARRRPRRWRRCRRPWAGRPRPRAAPAPARAGTRARSASSGWCPRGRPCPRRRRRARARRVVAARARAPRSAMLVDDLVERAAASRTGCSLDDRCRRDRRARPAGWCRRGRRRTSRSSPTVIPRRVADAPRGRPRR